MRIRRDILCRTIIECLDARKETLATAESCSGGLISEWLTRISGASQVFRGGIVAYSNDVKTQVLGVDPSIIKASGAVSENVAISMASQACRVFKSDWAISVTGIAGPTGGTREKPVGTVFIALASPSKNEVREYLFEKVSRQRVRELSALEALTWLHSQL